VEENKMMDIAKGLGRLTLPKPVRRYLRVVFGRYVFGRAMQVFLSLPLDADYPPRLLSNLVFGWSNENWSAQPEYMASFLQHARSARGPILECGSGLSTVLLGAIADKAGNKVWSLEHDPVWADKARVSLQSFNIRSVELCVNNLRDYGPYLWYDPPKEHLPSNFALVVCDGPPAATRGGRYGLLPVMKSHLKPGCDILLDDAYRAEEQEIVARWAKELGTTYNISGLKKPFAALTVPLTAQ
jgi:hypothetical protein